MTWRAGPSASVSTPADRRRRGNPKTRTRLIPFSTTWIPVCRRRDISRFERARDPTRGEGRRARCCGFNKLLACFEGPEIFEDVRLATDGTVGPRGGGRKFPSYSVARPRVSAFHPQNHSFYRAAPFSRVGARSARYVGHNRYRTHRAVSRERRSRDRSAVSMGFSGYRVVARGATQNITPYPEWSPCRPPREFKCLK